MAKKLKIIREIPSQIKSVKEISEKPQDSLEEEIKESELEDFSQFITSGSSAPTLVQGQMPQQVREEADSAETAENTATSRTQRQSASAFDYASPRQAATDEDERRRNYEAPVLRQDVPETIQRAFERERELSRELRLANNQLTARSPQEEDKKYNEGGPETSQRRRRPHEL